MTPLLAVGLAALLAFQGAVLQIHVLQGEGAVSFAGTRWPGLRLEITDEIGKPVAGAVVSVRLPDEGPGGVFSSGLASEILTTGPDGRAATSPIRWNRQSGPLQIRVTVVKERLRAGTLVSQTLSEGAGNRSAPAPVAARGKSRSKWPLVLLIAGGAAGAGLATGLAARGKHETITVPGSLQIGAPTITISNP
jgi:hypothetical protein